MTTQKRVQAPTTGQDARIQRRMLDAERNLDRLNRRPAGGGTWFAHPIANTTSGASANRLYASQINVLNPARLTGLVYHVGTTQNGNVKSGLYDITGARVATRTTNAAQGVVGHHQMVAFDAPYDAVPGLYFAALITSSATTSVRIGQGWAPATIQDEASFVLPATIAVPTAPYSVFGIGVNIGIGSY